MTSDGADPDRERERDEAKESPGAALRRMIASPGVATALVTTVFGSLGVAGVSNWVISRNADRELQFETVTALMKHTQDADLNDENAILKLNALTRLIQDNREFRVDVSGFQAIVERFRDDQLSKEREKARGLADDVEAHRKQARALEGEISDLQQQLDSNQELTQAARDRLRTRISDKNAELSQLTRQRDELQEQFDTLTVELRSAEDRLGKLAPLQEEVTRLRRALAEARENTRHEVVIRVWTSDGGDGIRGGATTDDLTVAFSKRSFDDAERYPVDLESHLLAKFTFPGRCASPGLMHEFVATARDLAFLESPYLLVYNEGQAGWGGQALSIRIDGKVVLDKVSLVPRVGYQDKGGMEFFNPGDWPRRKYWVGRLQELRSRN